MRFPFISRKAPLRLSDLSDADKKELLMGIPNAKERQFVEQRIGVPISKLADFGSFLDVGSKRVWASFRACHLVASVLLSAEVKAVQANKKGEAVDLDSTHPASVLLRTPNPYDSWEELLYMSTFHMKLCGTAYWLKDEMNSAGQPLALYPLLPQYVEADPDPKTKVKGWRYKVNGQTLTFTPQEVIQFRRPHPNNLIMGLGDVEPAQDTFATHIGRGDLEKKFLENGAQPSGIMTRKYREGEADLDETTWEAFKRKFNAQYGGKMNAGRTAFMTGEWSYHKLGLTMQEMQAIEREKWSIEQIFLIHGVPLSVAGIQGAANYATSRQDEINFRRHECVPLLDMFIGRMNMLGVLASAFGEGVRFDYNLSGLIDVEQVVKDLGPLVRLGSITPNELRVHCGLQKVDDPYLDQFFVDSTLIPLAMAGITGGADANKAAAGVVSGL